MGIDYSGNYGIGVRLCQFDTDETEYDDFTEYLEDLPEPNEFQLTYFEVGNTYNDESKIYLCIKNPFIGGLDMFCDKYKAFEKYLIENEIDFEGEIQEVGGLRVW